MTVEAGTQQERVVGRVWTVRLDPYGRPSAGTVRLSCSRPACPDERFGSAAAGRKAAIGHINMHLALIREGGGPRGGAWCACRAADCAWHAPDPTAGGRGGVRRTAELERCGGSVVLTVYADRAGRLWRIAEMCARCAAATTDCRVLDTAPPPARTAPARAGQVPDGPAGQREPAGAAGKACGENLRMDAGEAGTDVPGAVADGPVGILREERASSVSEDGPVDVQGLEGTGSC
ncbi:hypothetical protein ACWV95_36520 [Streptomyces albus]